MAKQRRQNSVVSAIQSVTAALRLESIPNPTKEQLQQIHDAKVAAADCIDNSNFVTMGEFADDAIEQAHQMAELEAGQPARQVEARIVEEETPILPPAIDNIPF